MDEMIDNSTLTENDKKAVNRAIENWGDDSFWPVLLLLIIFGFSGWNGTKNDPKENIGDG